jgi:Raf kinase inhibitor-like YbhB/YbcL family protein
MRVTSNSFQHGQAIPSRYAFMEIGDPVKPADNVTPHLAWTEVPATAKSFAIAVIDTDVPSKPDDVNVKGREVRRDLPRVEFVHWLMANIPAHCRELGEGACGEGVVPRGKQDPVGPEGSVQGLNDYSMWFKGDRDMEGHYHGYDGPCPPWNDTIPHHYHFHVYALDVERLELAPGFALSDLRDVMKGHVVDEAVLTGTYSLNPRVKA